MQPFLWRGSLPFVISAVLLLWAFETPAIEISTSDRVAMMYSSQLQFSIEGDPLIKVGLVEGQTSIHFTPSESIEVLPLGSDGPVIQLPGQREYVVSLIEGTRGTYRYWAVVARLFQPDRQILTETNRQWEERGFDPHAFELGSYFAIRGVAFDNRQTLVGVGGMEDRESALELASDLERQFGVPVDLHVELVSFPSGLIELSSAELGIVIRHHDILWIDTAASGRFSVPGQLFETGASGNEGEERHYAGSLVVTLDSAGTLALVNQVSAERLLEGILPAEIYPSAPTEALKAQAVAARSELLAELGVRHLADPYMTCANQHCQVYRGVGAEHARTSEAVQATRGQILLAGDHIARTVYSASCGGISGSYSHTWGHEPISYLEPHFDGAEPPEVFQAGLDEDGLRDFLAGRPDCYCNLNDFGGASTFRWQVEYSAEELTRIVQQRHDVGDVTGIEVLDRDPSGRVVRLRIASSTGDRVVERELAIRRALGGLRSALFVMDIETAPDGSLVQVRFTGGGFGHGVGLCQTGAIGAAQAGNDYAAILDHYYPSTRLQTLWH